MHRLVIVPHANGLLEGELYHKLARVLRMRESDVFVVQYESNNIIWRAYARVQSVTKNMLRYDLQQPHEYVSGSLDTHIGVCLGQLHDIGRMERAVQKCTERGIHRIVIVPMDRSQVHVLSPKKISRLKDIAMHAVMQSRGWYVPHIEWYATMQDRHNRYNGDVLIACRLDATNSSIHNVAKNTWAIVGPEGGFSPQEHIRLDTHAVGSLKWGSTVLRSETSALLAAHTLLGDK